MRAARLAFSAHERAQREGAPVAEVLGSCDVARERAREGGMTRREALAAGAGTLAGAALGRGSVSAFAAVGGRHAGARVAIVGAGLAGLRCAHALWTAPPAPLASAVYEANPARSGGRCWTVRGFFAPGLVTEHGGAFINSGQRPIRNLAAALGLKEEIVHGGDLPTGKEVFWIDGGYYTEPEATADWSAVGFRVFQAAARELGTAAGEERLDSLSVSEWLASTEIGTTSRFGKLMMANTVTENGGDPSEQSALDLIEIVAGKREGTLIPLPGDDERYHIVGGNDQLVSGMIAALPPGTVRNGHQLVALRQNADRSVTLTFDVAGSTAETKADLVVLALPFSTLRDVDLSRSGMSPGKLRVIRTLGMGTNAKIHLELRRKTWPALGFSGASYGEWDRFCCAWDDSVALGADASPAIYLAYPGGRVGAGGLTGAAHGEAPASDVAWFLAQIEHVFPGTTAAYTGRAYEDHWALDPYVHGAYSFYRVGQAATYGALAAAVDGPYVFAGEHTSSGNQGFLDGAVSTGERAALAVRSRTGG
jgi:monoamine oxidase